MNAQDRVKRAHVAIMQHKKLCAFSGILACGKITFTDAIPTACTDGWNRTYSPTFIDGLTDPELRFLILHEAAHVAYRHIHVWKTLWDTDARLANIAADHFVNLALVDMDHGERFIVMPKVGVQPEPRYRGWSVVMIFDDLKQNPPPQDPNGKGEGKGEGEGKGKGGGEGEGLDSHDWESGAGNTPAEQEVQEQEIQRAMRQGEIMRRKRQGMGSSDQSGVFGDLLQPKVDWRRVLRDFITETCAGRDESSWRKPNRRFLGDDVYMPSMTSTTITELVVLFDTSGSCFGGSEMARFVSEVKAIIEDIRPTKTHVLYVDTAVAGHQTFEDGQFAVQTLKPRGGGGTDLPVAFNYLSDQRIRPQAMVVLTDGYTPFGTAPEYPVLWAMTSNISSPWGTTIHIGE